MPSKKTVEEPITKQTNTNSKIKTKISIITVVVVLCIILALLIAININKDSSNQNNNNDDVQLIYTKEDLINTTYKSKEGATLSFTIDGDSLIANVEYTKDTDIEDYNKANFKWVQSIDIVSNKLLFTDSYHTIVYDEGKDNENDMFVYQLKSGFFTINEDNSITWDGCPEADYRLLTFIKK